VNVAQRQGETLQYLVILPDDYDSTVGYPLLVLLHGFGASMRDLAGLAPAISTTGYIYLCPNAPIPFDLGGGQQGFGWYTPRSDSTAGEIQESELLLEGFFEEAFAEFPQSTGALLMGFSQGGGMTLRSGIGRPEAFAGLGALSPALPEPNELTGKLPEQRDQHIFVSHGHHDPLIALEDARAIHLYLEEAGYAPSYNEYVMGHEISAEVLSDLVAWMTNVLPPLR
jgi:phospholipase/carboxylesterase